MQVQHFQTVNFSLRLLHNADYVATSRKDIVVMNADDIVYRYMSYAEFLDIIRFQKLTLKYPGLWPDKLEALFLKHFESDDNVKKVIGIYKNKYKSFPLDYVKSDLQIISSVLFKTRCQCWTHKEDDLVMWNERGGSEIVRIAVSKKSFEKYRECGLVHRAINYVAKVDLNQLLDRFVKDRIVTEFVLMKKLVFDYEDEYRIVLLPENHNFSFSSYGNNLSEFLCRHFQGLKSEFGLSEKYLPFNTNDIVNVKISPYATNIFSKLVKADCEQFGIKYSGISAILD